MTVDELAARIQRLSERALALLPPRDPARRAAKTGLIRPIDYMRWAEFASILRRLQLQPGQRVLDLASPQWLTVALAEAHPNVDFLYSNILETEIAPFRRIAELLAISNVRFAIEDARTLSFADAAFDHIISVSVIEHIFPADGGDYQALRELRRVLKPEGRLHITVPYKDRRNVVYLQGSVFERSGKGKQFFAREYDHEQFDKLLRETGFAVEDQADLICERDGVLALDSFTWGPRANRLSRTAALAARVVAERLIGRSFDATLARRYLSASPVAQARLVNIAARLRKAD